MTEACRRRPGQTVGRIELRPLVAHAPNAQIDRCDRGNRLVDANGGRTGNEARRKDIERTAATIEIETQKVVSAILDDHTLTLVVENGE